MSSKLSFARKRFTTMVALVRFFTRMNSHVHGQRTANGKGFPTFGALVRSFTSVNSHVSQQRSFARTPLPTSFALIRFFACVSSGVSSQVTGLSEFRATHVADVGPIASVYSQMRHQIRALLKPTTAHFALESVLHMCTVYLHMLGNISTNFSGREILRRLGFRSSRKGCRGSSESTAHRLLRFWI